MNPPAPEIAIYLCTFRHVLLLQWHTLLMHNYAMLVIYKQTRTAATRLVLTVVILNSNETSGPLSNGRVLKMCSVYRISFSSELLCLWA